MTFLRTIIALTLTSVLAACGGQYDNDATAQTASATITASAPILVDTAETGPNTSAIPAPRAPVVATVASATMPAPDCAAEGCASLRIIDGNAEAWRIDARRRAALEASLPQS